MRMVAGTPSDLGPALVAAAEVLCTTVEVPVHAPAADLVVHVDADTLVETARLAQNADAAGTLDPRRRAWIDDGPGLLHSTLQMLACDGRLQVSVNGPDGRTLDLGRRRRRPSRRQLAALWRRGRGCAMPGCDRTRFLHAHHVRAWALGGSTDMDNLILLCGEHHRLLHEGGFSITALGKQKFRFHGPGGALRPQAPAMTGEAATLTNTYTGIEPATIEPDWYGERLHLREAVAGYLTAWNKKPATSKPARND
ncbi:MAG: DUF222 domain-containing protein [Propionibacteriales bacterium]|nr:DUF222 domain-containing protein [Propionibacteriales bacterium]